MVRPALLIIDMQNHFREGMAEAIVHRLNSLAAACHRATIPVIYTQHGHPNPEKEEAESVLVAWWGPANSIRYGSSAWELLPELDRPPGSHVIASKRTYDAFQGTELGELLSSAGADAVIVGGVMTNLCCETTARSAFTKNFSVVFLGDGTATAEAAMQAATLLNLGYGFARVMSCGECEGWVGRGCEG